VVTPALADKAAGATPHACLEADEGPPVIVAAGRLVPQKNFSLLLNAIARLRQERLARLIILGGRARALPPRGAGQAPGGRLQRRIARLRDQPHAAFVRAALLVRPSDYEGLPYVLIQTLACGCPMVSTDCRSGLAEILQEGHYGELVPTGNAKALAAAMARALDAPPSKQVLRRRGAEFSLARSAACYLNLMLPGDGNRAHTGTHHRRTREIKA